jgi:23S rRNA pseudouridine2605 synthase
VRVGGQVVLDPGRPIVPERAQIEVNGVRQRRAPWRTIAFYKPRGILTTRRDPEGRQTIFDVLGETGRGLVPVGRLDRATSGLLVLTNDTRLANWIADPANAVPRLYLVTVRGRVTPGELRRLTDGIAAAGERLQATGASVRKASGRESHLTIELQEGRNREVRRLLEATGHEVTALKRVKLGRLALGDLRPGEWRQLRPADVRQAFGARVPIGGHHRLA